MIGEGMGGIIESEMRENMEEEVEGMTRVLSHFFCGVMEVGGGDQDEEVFLSAVR